MILKKQTHLTGVWTTELDFDPSTENEEAGTAVFWSCFAYAAIVVRKGTNENERSVILRWTDPECDEYKVREVVNAIWHADGRRSSKSKGLCRIPAQSLYKYPLSLPRIPWHFESARTASQSSWEPYLRQF